MQGNVCKARFAKRCTINIGRSSHDEIFHPEKLEKIQEFPSEYKFGSCTCTQPKQVVQGSAKD